MTRANARSQARREISRVHVVAANRHTQTYGATVSVGGGWSTTTPVGSYRDAVEARRAWIAERVEALTNESP